ncbi:MAG TPA: glycosyltransferase [Planctomycetota bacterium]|nr:glycosyltransferase [Planctomycetota bacterium]
MIVPAVDPEGRADMRLVHLMGSLEVGGRERVVLDLARRARARGLEHSILLFDRPWRGDERDFDPGAVPWELLPRRGGLDLRFVRALARTLRGVDVVHAHNDTAIAYAGLARAWALGRFPALVGTFHTYPGHDTPAARRVTRWATKRAGAVTAVSRELGERLEAAGWTCACEVIRNGVDGQAYCAGGATGEQGERNWRERWGVHENELLVGHVGRFDPIKRQDDLLQALQLVRGRGLKVHGAFAGEGPARGGFEARAAAAPGVHVVPRVRDVAAFLRALDVFVLCSAHEATPRALLEAMACGLPCVATAVGGVPELLADGAGVLVPAGEPDALAAAIEALAADPARRAALGRAARARAEEHSAEREWANYLALWGRITSRTSGGSRGPS